MEKEPPLWDEIKQTLMDAVEDPSNSLTLEEAIERLAFYRNGFRRSIGRVILDEDQRQASQRD